MERESLFFFPLPLAHEYSFSFSRFPPLLFNRSICNCQTDSWWVVLFGFSLTQLSRSYKVLHFKVILCGFELTSNYHPSITKRTAWPTDSDTPSHHCLSIIPTNPRPRHCLSSIRLLKCIRNDVCFIFFARDWEKNKKKHFHSVEIGNDILVFINIKREFLDSLIKSTVFILIFCQNSMAFEGSPNSLAEAYFTGQLRLGEF